jgi:hypothetical protein
VTAIAWTTIEDAIHNWVSESSGLPEEQVIWSDRGGPRPATPYIAMRIDDVMSVGHDWRVYDDAPVSVPGEELRLRAEGHRTASLGFQCFATDGGGHLATQILADVIAGIAIHLHSLDLAGVGVGDYGSVRHLEGRRGDILEPRAISEVSLHLSSEVEPTSPSPLRIQRESS